MNRRCSVDRAESLNIFCTSGVIGSAGAVSARHAGAALLCAGVTTEVVSSLANTSVRLVGLAALAAT